MEAPTARELFTLFRSEGLSPPSIPSVRATARSPSADCTSTPTGSFTARRCSGAYGYGTVFRFTLAGALDYVHLFELDGIDGIDPLGGLAAGPGGELFGTTLAGGDENLGTIYKVDAAGDYAQTHSLVEAEGGNVYDASPTDPTEISTASTSAGNGTAIRSADGIDFELPARVHARRGLRKRLEPRRRPRRQLLRCSRTAPASEGPSIG